MRSSFNLDQNARAHQAAGACAEWESAAVVCFCAQLSPSLRGLTAEAPQGPR